MKKPLISQGWLRTIIFMMTYLIALTVVSLIAFGIWFVFQDKGTADRSKFQILIDSNFRFNIFINTVSAILSVWFSRKYIDKQSILSLGFVWKGFKNHALTGLFGGIAMLSFGTIFLIILKYLSFTNFEFNWLALLNGAMMMVLIAFYEELIFRGYILNNLMQDINKWWALAISAFIFMCVHLGNPGMDFLSSVEIFIAGIALGINYIYTKNLWFGFGLHFSWNFLQGPILGYQVSGINLPSTLHQSLTGPTFITGGAFGFEGSALCFIVNITFIVILVCVYEKKSLAIIN